MEENIYDKIERIYIEKGIVTRKDDSFIDRRVGGRTSWGEMLKRGHTEAFYFEIYKDYDYSGILYNTDMFEYEFAYDYLEKYILKKEPKLCLKLIQLEIF